MLPIDVRSDAVEAVDDVFTAVDEETFQKMVEAKKATLEKAKTNIVAAQEKQKQTNTVQVLRCTRWVQLFSKRISHGKREKEENLIVIGSVHLLLLES